ncbi:MAG: anti-sigma factor [Actinomycetota bacterium]
MTDHEAIWELLAGYALRSLSGPDGAEADRLLAGHVPGCPECRDHLESFGLLASDLALAIQPLDPPDLLLARLHRDMEPDAGALRRFGAGWIAAAAAGLVALVVLGSLALSGGGTSATLAVADLQQAVAAAARPGARTNDLGAVDEVALPDRSGFYLWGEDVPQPSPGQVYRLWLLVGQDAYYVGQFVPDPSGVVAIQVEVRGAYDEVIITTEDATSAPEEPSGTAWSVSSTPATPAP